MSTPSQNLRPTNMIGAHTSQESLFYPDSDCGWTDWRNFSAGTHSSSFVMITGLDFGTTENQDNVVRDESSPFLCVK